MRLKLTLEYEGTRFRGWATQPNLRTVEGVVREALGWVYGRYENLAVAGRTDTGVHALGQVISVDVEGGPPIDRAAKALNTALPDDVTATPAEEASPDSTPATRRRRGAIAIGSGVARRRRRSSSTAVTGIHIRSTTTRLPTRSTC